MIDRYRWLLLTLGAATIPLFFLPITPEDPFLVPKQFLLSFIACGALSTVLYPIEGLMQDSLRSLIFPSLIFLSCLAISIPNSTNHHVAIDELKRWMYLLILLFTAARINWSFNRLKLFIKISIIVSAIISISVLLEHFKLVPFYVFPFTTNHIYSFFGADNILAQYLTITILWGIGSIFISENIRTKVLVMACTALSIAALLITLCRGAIISIVSGGILFSFLYLKAKCFDQLEKRKFKVLMVLFITILVAGIFVSNEVTDGKEIDRLIMEFKKADSGRFPIWKDALSKISSSPLAGVGIGNYSLRYVNNAHNELLHMGVESGIIGVSGFLAFLFFLFKHSRRQYLSQDNSEIKIVHLAIISSCFATLLHSMFSFNLQSATSSFFFFIGLGILCADSSNRTTNSLLSNKMTMRNIMIISLTTYLSLWALYGEYKRIMSHYSYSQAISSFKQKDIPKSLDYSLKSIQYQPYNSKYHQFISTLYSKTGQLELAKTHYKKAKMLSVVTNYSGRSK